MPWAGHVEQLGAVTGSRLLLAEPKRDRDLRVKFRNSGCHTVWRDKPRFNIPGSIWLPDTGYGRLAPSPEDYLRQGLARVTKGNKNVLLVIYCQADCWMSWNAAKRAISFGYSNVAWYPEGTDGWTFYDLPTQESQPEPRPDEEMPSPR